jgi:tRNA nucleotidyltransferase (CCA-adding enzyme)
METINDYSYGVIPVQKNGTIWKVFLINQIPRQGNLFWTFPKGHPEEQETQKETALRELFEEAGIVPDQLSDEKTFTQEYSFTFEDTLINKKVVYYLGFVSTDVYVLQEDEVAEAGWYSFAEAQELLTHDIARELLTKVAVYLKDTT